MKILFLATDYPYDDYPAAGIYNERCVRVLKETCETVEVLVPRPVVPPLLSRLSSRWNSYTRMNGFEIRNGVPVHRPGYLQVPLVNPAFWLDPGAFYWCRRHATGMHRRVGFDAILAFGLVSGFAWRLGRHLGIPAIGWAIGVIDVSAPLSSTRGRSLTRALKQLDMVFYQSRQLRSCAAAQLQIAEHELPSETHVVLPHGIPAPPSLPVSDTRERIRAEWQVNGNHTVALFIGRIVKDKGVFDLLKAVKTIVSRQKDFICVLAGAFPGFDDTAEVEAILRGDGSLNERVRILPACHPEKVWEYLYAADLFAFPSHEEGMPNALLEAMAVGVPSVAYDIPPVVELDGRSGGILLVPAGDAAKLADGLLQLSMDSDQRAHRGRIAQARAHERFMVARNVPEALARIERLIHTNSMKDATRYQSARLRA